MIATFGISHGVALAQEQEILLRVVDNQGRPLSDATVRFDYTIKGQSKRQSFPALTDSNGLVSVTTSAITLEGIDVSRDGHYGSWLSGDSVRYGELFEIPLNPVANPLPLYARKVSLELDMAAEQPVGFDFFAGDWVSPHGSGEVADLLFTPVTELPLPGGQRVSAGFHLAVTFPNAGDGILPYPLDYPQLESDFPYPYVAPTEGYEPDIYFKYDRIGSILQPGVTPPPLYPFAFARIRTQWDADGRIASAHYLKLYPSIEAFLFSPEKANVEMTYYLNKYSNNRNLEFQQGSNLNDKDDGSRSLTNLNLMEKNSYARKILEWPDSIDFLKKSHYRTAGEIEQQLRKQQAQESREHSIVFVTDGSWQGDLGGSEGADAKCQAEADASAALRGRQFKAWLSRHALKGPDNNARFHRSTRPYATLDGNIVAKNYRELVDVDAYRLIDMAASGEKITGASIWTNTQANGQGSMKNTHCAGWTSASSELYGAFGLVSTLLQNNCANFGLDCNAWTMPTHNSIAVDQRNNPGPPGRCHVARRLYCFEQ